MQVGDSKFQVQVVPVDVRQSVVCLLLQYRVCVYYCSTYVTRLHGVRGSRAFGRLVTEKRRDKKLLLTRSSPSRHPPSTQHPSPSRSLVCDGKTSPHKPRLVVPHSTCPSLSPSPPAHSFIIGPAVINTQKKVVVGNTVVLSFPYSFPYVATPAESAAATVKMRQHKW